MAQLEILKTLLAANTDLSRYADNDDLLNYALSYAQSEILKRRGADTLEDQYQMNQIEGALYYLSRIGTEGAYSTSENGEQTVYKDVPPFLANVFPRLGVIRDA
jgi:hypothetical protein